MELKIRELKLRNFKGERDFTLSPDEKLTSVHGTNGVGKTTLCDAWMWLWTGKDMKDRADYEIKTKNKNGDVEHRLEHTVSAVIDVDCAEYDLSRTYKENWVKPTGEKEHVLKSHTTEYIWDTIPLTKKSDFDERVNNLFGDIERFRLLSNPRYFLNIDWKKRRLLLMELAGVTDEGVMKHLAETNEEFSRLISDLKNNTLDDFRKKLNAEKKELKKKIDEVPVKIREATLAIPEEPDYFVIESNILATESNISLVDAEIADITKSFEAQSQSIKENQNKILEKERQIAKMESDAKTESDRLSREEGKKLSELNGRLVEIETSIRSLNSEQALIINKIHNKESEIDAQNRLIDKLRGEYTSFGSMEMDESKTICPACKQKLSADDIEEVVKKFNVEKEQKIQENIRKGKSEKEILRLLTEQRAELFEQKDKLISSIDSKQAEKETIQNEIQEELKRDRKHFNYVDILNGNLEYDGLKQEIAALKSTVQTIEKPDVSLLQEKRSIFSRELDALKEQLSIRAMADKQRSRIKELESELKTLSQELATIEGKEFVADKFNRAKVEAIENGVNGKFETIRWRMFRPLINGGEEECCEAVLSCGNIYEAANNAGQINAGIECINTLSEFYGMCLPVFIDNAESVVDLIPTNSQVIRFVVDGNCSKLTIK